jgi:hypothetical protein
MGLCLAGRTVGKFSSAEEKCEEVPRDPTSRLTLHSCVRSFPGFDYTPSRTLGAESMRASSLSRAMNKNATRQQNPAPVGFLLVADDEDEVGLPCCECCGAVVPRTQLDELTKEISSCIVWVTAVRVKHATISARAEKSARASSARWILNMRTAFERFLIPPFIVLSDGTAAWHRTCPKP